VTSRPAFLSRVSLPPQQYEEVERIAKQEQKTKSELFRDMVRVYEDFLDERRWSRLRRVGADSAKKPRVRTEADIERLVHEARGIKG
jgi:metal-responsive CopG/Arc/MetJ family transcriptional regulator